LAVCYLKSGDREQGEKLLQKAMRLDPKLANEQTTW
jgi:Tfp pilus assembly protein PilF